VARDGRTSFPRRRGIRGFEALYTLVTQTKRIWSRLYLPPGSFNSGDWELGAPTTLGELIVAVTVSVNTQGWAGEATGFRAYQRAS
jgi:hypothetical protein